MSGPDLAQLRAVCQPADVMGRYNAEHWAGALYMRRLSLRLTWAVVRTPLTANGVTWLMVVSGWLAAAALLAPGVGGALLAVLLTQNQILLDCSDGEVARWRRTFSPAGVYLDRIGHYTTEALLPIGLGIRAQGELTLSGGWVTAGFAVAVLVLLNKAETDLVHVARAFAGLPKLDDSQAVAAPTRSGLARLRSWAGHLPFYRAFVAVELSLLVLAAALGDLVTGGLTVTRLLLAVLLPLAAVTAAGHLLAVLTSRRLR